MLFILFVKAELEGVSAFSLIPGANFRISVRNPLSDFEVREKVVINPSEHVEQEENSREPPCHFAIKWEGSHKRSTVEVLDSAATKAALKKAGKKGKNTTEHLPRDFTADDSGEWVPMLALECRGVEPYAFHAMGEEFVVTSEGGAKFESDIDLSEEDWADYDEENDTAVSISNFEAKFERK